MDLKRSSSIMLLVSFFTALLVLSCATMDLVKVEVMLSQEKYNEAIPVLEKYLRENPNYLEAENKLGFAYLKTGDVDRAIASLEDTLAAHPGNSHTVFYLGLAYLNKEKYEKAIEVWRGIKDQKRPHVEKEIQRLLTLIQIAESQKAAKAAIANENSLQAATLDKSTIAVCYYKDLSENSQLQGFQKGLAAMVVTDLSKIKALRIVERVRLQALLQEMELGRTGIVDPGTAPRIGRLVGAENLVVGTLTGKILVATTLASSTTRKIKGSTAATIAKEAFFEIPQGIVLDTAKILDIQLTAAEKDAIGTPHTKSYTAVVYYGQALDAIDVGHWSKAKNLFARALREDPQFDLAKEGFDGCPDDTAPTVAQLATMTVQELSAMAETMYTNTVSTQDEAAKIAEDDENDGNGGNGGGGH